MATIPEFQTVEQVEAERVEGGKFITGKYPDDQITQGFGLSNEQKASHDLVNAVTIVA